MKSFKELGPENKSDNPFPERSTNELILDVYRILVATVEYIEAEQKGKERDMRLMQVRANTIFAGIKLEKVCENLGIDFSEQESE